MIGWAIKWRQENKLDGKTERFMPSVKQFGFVLFRTRAEAKAHIRGRFGYIAHRPDLLREPHGWKMPIAVKVEMILKEVR